MSAAKREQVRETFAKYDKNGDGTIQLSELIGVMKAITTMREADIEKLFKTIDKDGSGGVDCDEFVDWVFGASRKNARAKAALVPSDASGVELAFYNFCGAAATDMDGRGFAKLCKDCKLLDKSFTATDADLVFSKVVVKGQRRIDVEQFERALRLVAEKKGADLEQLREAVGIAGSPALRGTQADAVRFHDDKSTFTGMHSRDGRHAGTGAPAARGSPSPQQAAAAQPATAAGSRPSSRAGTAPTAAAAAAAATASASASSSGPRPAQATVQKSEAGTLLEAFKGFCGTAHDLDGRGFTKLCKDCGIVDKKFTATDADLLFAKVVTKGQRRIGYHQFEDALKLVAEKKGVQQSEVEGAVLRCGGPVLTGTQTEAVRFHDDKTTYTGTHGTDGRHSPASASAAAGSGGERPAAAAAASIRETARTGLVAWTLREVYQGFCGTSADLDGKSFTKLCKDCGLFDRKFTSTDADLIFAKVVTKGQRRIAFDQFEDALKKIAEKKGVDIEALDEAMLRCGGPVLQGTKTDAVRFHDDKSTYTGSHAF